MQMLVHLTHALKLHARNIANSGALLRTPPETIKWSGPQTKAYRDIKSEPRHAINLYVQIVTSQAI